MNNTKPPVFALALIACLAPFFGLPGQSGQEEVFFFQQVSVAENLTSQNYNYYIYKDSDGFVWISSINGLNRFDGREVKKYLPDPNILNSLTDGNIQSRFFEDSEGGVWFNTVEAIHQYDRMLDGFHSFRPNGAAGETQKEYQLLYLDTLENELWYREKQMLYYFSVGDSLRARPIGKYALGFRSWLGKIPDIPGVCLLHPGQKGLETVFFEGHAAVARHFYKLGENTGEIHIETVLPESRNRVWAGTDAGLFTANLADGSVRRAEMYNGDTVKNIVGLAQAGEGFLIVATRKSGLYFLDKGSMAYTGQVYSNAYNKIAPFLYEIDRIYLDGEQTLWISSPGNGVFFTNLKKRRFAAYLQNKEGSPQSRAHILAMSEDNRGRIWCLTRDGIVVIDKKGKPLPGFERFRGDGLPFEIGESFYLYRDREDRLWVCAQAGLFLLRSPDGNFEKVDAASPSGSSSFTYIRQLVDMRILASSASQGMYEFVEEDPDNLFLRPMPEMQGMSGEFTMSYEDSRGRVWLCQNNKRIWILHRVGQALRVEDSLELMPMVTAILEDPGRSCVWIATDQGLYRVTENPGHYSMQKDSVLSGQVLNSLLQDENGCLWAGANRGLIRYMPDSSRLTIYGLSDGLQAQEFNFWSCLKTSDGLLAFGGINGVNIFDPAKVRELGIEARPVITNILVNDAPIHGLKCAISGTANISYFKKLVMPYSQNTLTFFFAPREYSSSSSNQFRYQMRGIDEAPVYNGAKTLARYPNIPPGAYRFIVEATNSDGEWNGMVQLEVVIRPPFWQRWWFRGLVFLAIALALYAFYRFRINQVKKKEEFLRREAEFRQKEAEYRQKEAEYKQLVAETETAVLRLQMNPHFIFNSMNSINSYILQRDINTANEYLVRFSRLMRMILKFAEQPYISAGEEIDLLEQYLKAESMRFEQKFEYEFEVAEEVDEDDYLLPTMILQPFVENAILHGITPKPEGGKICIRFQLREKNVLYVTIEDDGIGRAAAAKLKEKTKEHESKAIGITRRRLKLLEEESGQAATFEISDLFDEKGNAAGTRVTLSLPQF